MAWLNLYFFGSWIPRRIENTGRFSREFSSLKNHNTMMRESLLKTCYLIFLATSSISFLKRWLKIWFDVTRFTWIPSNGSSYLGIGWSCLKLPQHVVYLPRRTLHDMIAMKINHYLFCKMNDVLKDYFLKIHTLLTWVVFLWVGHLLSKSYIMTNDASNSR